MAHTSALSSLCTTAAIFLTISLNTAVAQAQSNSSEHQSDSCMMCDFNDSTLMHNPDALEKTFIAFADRMQRQSPTEAAADMRRTAEHLCAIRNERRKELLRQRLEQYAQRTLGDSTSAEHNALLHSMFTKILNLTYYADMAKRNGNEYMRKNLEKNMPGSPATDFAFTDRKGKNHTLYKEKAALTMLFFYDPDCHVCHEIAGQLAKVSQLTAGDNIKVLSIYTDMETERWKAHAPDFPKSWIDGYSPDGKIMREELYHLPVIPSIYLLDADKCVLLRDVSPETLTEVIKQLTNN